MFYNKNLRNENIFYKYIIKVVAVNIIIISAYIIWYFLSNFKVSVFLLIFLYYYSVSSLWIVIKNLNILLSKTFYYPWPKCFHLPNGKFPPRRGSVDISTARESLQTAWLVLLRRTRHASRYRRQRN